MVIHFNLNILCVNLSVKGLCFYFFFDYYLKLFNYSISIHLSCYPSHQLNELPPACKYFIRILVKFGQ